MKKAFCVSTRKTCEVRNFFSVLLSLVISATKVGGALFYLMVLVLQVEHLPVGPEGSQAVAVEWKPWLCGEDGVLCVSERDTENRLEGWQWPDKFVYVRPLTDHPRLLTVGGSVIWLKAIVLVG
jgi:hypothetical protein